MLLQGLEGLNALVREGRVTQGAAAGIRGDIDRAYAAVKDPNAYKPAEFQASFGSAVRAIEALPDLIRRGDASANVMLMPGDTIIIPESRF